MPLKFANERTFQRINKNNPKTISATLAVIAAVLANPEEDQGTKE